ncbi:MAG: MFS transporter [Woeseiaceae bacterium]
MSEISVSAFSSRNYRKYLYGNICSVLGVWIQRLALGWHAWQLSESALIVGLVAAAQFMPLIVLTPFFGVVVDRVNTRLAAIAMHAVLALIATLLAVLTLSGNMTIEWLGALALMHGLANSAYSPVRLALIPNLVRKEQFPSAVAIASMTFNISRFIGPGIAGAIVALYGLAAAYAINAVTYLPVILALAIIRIDERPEDKAPAKPYFAQLLEGIRYTRDHAQIRQIILLSGVSNFFGRGILELMPAFAALIFEGGSAELAALMAAAGIGAILASLLFSFGAFRHQLHAVVAIGSIGVGLSIAFFGWISTLPMGIFVVLLLAMFASVVSIGSQTEVQILVENRLRGRVMSLWTLVIMGGPAVGSVVAGALAGDIGATYTSYAFAATCFFLILVVGLKRPNPSTVADH